jgi:glycopeptide antibiotics resistance protein
LGVFIYLCFRPNTLNVFYWINSVGLAGVLTFVRSNLFVYQNLLPNWIVNSLPDGLWAYSFIYTINLVWKEKQGGYWLWILISSIIIYLSEVLQYYKVVHGTFDVQDLIFLSLGIALSTIIISFKTKKYETTI